MGPSRACAWHPRTSRETGFSRIPLDRRGRHRVGPEAATIPPAAAAREARAASPWDSTEHSLGVDERLELLGPARMPKLAQRLGFDLPDALARDLEVLPHLFQG